MLCNFMQDCSFSYINKHKILEKNNDTIHNKKQKEYYYEPSNTLYKKPQHCMHVLPFQKQLS